MLMQNAIQRKLLKSLLIRNNSSNNYRYDEKSVRYNNVVTNALLFNVKKIE